MRSAVAVLVCLVGDAGSQRNLVKNQLLDMLFLGRDAVRELDVADAWKDWPDPADCSPAQFDMTHVHVADIDTAAHLARGNGNVTFWLEFGSYHGGSAIITADALKVLHFDSVAVHLLKFCFVRISRDKVCTTRPSSASTPFSATPLRYGCSPSARGRCC